MFIQGVTFIPDSRVHSTLLFRAAFHAPADVMLLLLMNDINMLFTELMQIRTTYTLQGCNLKFFQVSPQNHLPKCKRHDFQKFLSMKEKFLKIRLTQGLGRLTFGYAPVHIKLLTQEKVQYYVCIGPNNSLRMLINITKALRLFRLVLLLYKCTYMYIH